MYPNKTLLVITNTPLTPHAYEAFGVNTTYKGWKIIYWNILPFVNKKLDQEYSNKAVKFQSGFIYDYAFVMFLGLTCLLTYLIIN